MNQLPAWLKFWLNFGFAIVLLLLVSFWSLIGWAAAQAVVNGFKADKELERGQVVAISKQDSSFVEPAPAGDLSRMYGVVVDPNDAPLTVSSRGQNVFVATSGRYQVLVNTKAGAINKGDYLSMSHLDGVAAKATARQSLVLGRALEPFDGKSAALISSQDGDKLGRIVTEVGIGKNPLISSDRVVIEFLQRTGEAIAGKSVSAIRIYSALAVFIITAIIVTIILWSGIRNAMIAIGRNPLSRHSILQSLAQVIVAASVIFISGLFGIYLLLKL